jgi:hypothetical protein
VSLLELKVAHLTGESAMGARRPVLLPPHQFAVPLAGSMQSIKNAPFGELFLVLIICR